MYEILVHKQFLKDLKKVDLNQTNTEKLFKYVSLLVSGKNLPAEARNHQLTGNLKDFREFHVAGDLLVLYRKDRNNKRIELLRIGTHSQLFR